MELEGVIPSVFAGDASRPHHETRTLATWSDKECELTLLEPADGTELRVVADVAPSLQPRGSGRRLQSPGGVRLSHQGRSAHD